MTDKHKPSTQDKGNIAQNASIDDKDHDDRPGTRKGQPQTNNDYDYRPDFGDTGGSVEQEDGKVLDGKPVDQKRKPDGDKPEDSHKPAEKWDKAKA